MAACEAPATDSAWGTRAPALSTRTDACGKSIRLRRYRTVADFECAKLRQEHRPLSGEGIMVYIKIAEGGKP
eukprot:gene15286-21369_t